MPGPQKEWRTIGDLYVEASPLELVVIGRDDDATTLSREQALELRDFLNRQFPTETRDGAAL
jgi:hypothetical protein